MPGIKNSKLYTFAFLALSFMYSAQSSAEDWVYTVRAGDTLWGLCIEYTTVQNCWQKIGAYNNVEYPRSLAPGTRIKFPVAWLKNQPAAVELVYIHGSVSVLSQFGSADPVARAGVTGETLSMGAVVVTGENSSATLKFADGAILVLESDSKVVLDSLSQNGEAGMVDSKIRLLQGSSSAKVPVREPRSRFSITSPSAVAAVRGTDFRVTTLGSESPVMRGSVYEGSIVVVGHGDDAAVPVETGFGVMAEQGKPVGQPLELLSEPTFTTAPDAQFYPLKIDWGNIDGAEHYVVEVLADSSDAKLIQLHKSEDSEVIVPMDEPACYRIRVSGVDKKLFKGMPGEIKLCGQPRPEEPPVQKKDRTKEVMAFLIVLLLVGL